MTDKVKIIYNYFMAVTDFVDPIFTLYIIIPGLIVHDTSMHILDEGIVPQKMKIR